jgi:hypothetical protein
MDFNAEAFDTAVLDVDDFPKSHGMLVLPTVAHTTLRGYALTSSRISLSVRYTGSGGITKTGYIDVKGHSALQLDSCSFGFLHHLSVDDFRFQPAPVFCRFRRQQLPLSFSWSGMNMFIITMPSAIHSISGLTRSVCRYFSTSFISDVDIVCRPARRCRRFCFCLQRCSRRSGQRDLPDPRHTAPHYYNRSGQ